MWIARDADFALWLYDTKPVLKSDERWAGDDIGQLDPQTFLDVTYRNSPQAVKIVRML